MLVYHQDVVSNYYLNLLAFFKGSFKEPGRIGRGLWKGLGPGHGRGGKGPSGLGVKPPVTALIAAASSSVLWFRSLIMIFIGFVLAVIKMSVTLRKVCKPTHV